MYAAKHARSRGLADTEDGIHAVYYAEIPEVLERIGFNLPIADDYRVLFTRSPVDLVFPLLNQSGFLNSAMMLPLPCNRLWLPYLGSADPARHGRGIEASAITIDEQLVLPTMMVSSAISGRTRRSAWRRGLLAERITI